MATTKSSSQEAANHFGLNNRTLIEAWKLKFLNNSNEALSIKSGRHQWVKIRVLKRKS